MKRARLSTRFKFWARHNFRRVTPLTWLIWALLISDLAAPGYLRFNLFLIQVDASSIIKQAISQARPSDSLRQ